MGLEPEDVTPRENKQSLLIRLESDKQVFVQYLSENYFILVAF